MYTSKKYRPASYRLAEHSTSNPLKPCGRRDEDEDLSLRLRALFGAGDLNRESSDKVRFHIDMQTEENIRAGMSPEEGRRQACIRFG
ncbi:MAG TPA: permease prefix domain 1-containing protein [Longimicrobiaceae bacterium]|nr:permease prefix domain 1-containing protein [Longimicrobiaceae bacterium]